MLARLKFCRLSDEIPQTSASLQKTQHRKQRALPFFEKEAVVLIVCSSSLNELTKNLHVCMRMLALPDQLRLMRLLKRNQGCQQVRHIRTKSSQPSPKTIFFPYFWAAAKASAPHWKRRNYLSQSSVSTPKNTDYSLRSSRNHTKMSPEGSQF